MKSMHEDERWAERQRGVIEQARSLGLLGESSHPPALIGGSVGPIRPQDLPAGSMAFPNIGFAITQCLSETDEQTVYAVLLNAITFFSPNTVPEIIYGCYGGIERFGVYASRTSDPKVEAARQAAVEQLAISNDAEFGLFVSESLLNTALQAQFKQEQKHPPVPDTTLQSAQLSLQQPSTVITTIRGNETMTWPAENFSLVVRENLVTKGGVVQAQVHAELDADWAALAAISFFLPVVTPLGAYELAALFFHGPDGETGVGSELAQKLPTKLFTGPRTKRNFLYDSVELQEKIGINFSGSISAEVARQPKVYINGPAVIQVHPEALRVAGVYAAQANDEFTPDQFIWTLDGHPLPTGGQSVTVMFSVAANAHAGTLIKHTLQVAATDSSTGLEASNSYAVTIEVVKDVPPYHGPPHPPITLPPGRLP